MTWGLLVLAVLTNTALFFVVRRSDQRNERGPR